MFSYQGDLMALQVHFKNPIEKHRFPAETVVYYPHDLIAHFKENDKLKIEAGINFYVWMNGESLEWKENDTPTNLSLVKTIFNRVLQPLGKSMSQIVTRDERLKLGTFNDGFYILTLNHPFVLVATCKKTD
jgi:hypothetical protein